MTTTAACSDGGRCTWPRGALPQVAWPTHSDEPINEFTCVDLFSRVFPTLFPYGDSQLRSVRQITLSAVEYILHLMKLGCGLFAQHQRWRYTALNCSQRWRASAMSKVFVQRRMSRHTVRSR